MLTITVMTHSGRLNKLECPAGDERACAQLRAQAVALVIGWHRLYDSVWTVTRVNTMGRGSR